jgi:hypothetical protein
LAWLLLLLLLLLLPSKLGLATAAPARGLSHVRYDCRGLGGGFCALGAVDLQDPLVRRIILAGREILLAQRTAAARTDAHPQQ